MGGIISNTKHINISGISIINNGKETYESVNKYLYCEIRNILMCDLDIVDVIANMCIYEINCNYKLNQNIPLLTNISNLNDLLLFIVKQPMNKNNSFTNDSEVKIVFRSYSYNSVNFGIDFCANGYIHKCNERIIKYLIHTYLCKNMHVSYEKNIFHLITYTNFTHVKCDDLILAMQSKIQQKQLQNDNSFRKITDMKLKIEKEFERYTNLKHENNKHYEKYINSPNKQFIVDTIKKNKEQITLIEFENSKFDEIMNISKYDKFKHIDFTNKIFTLFIELTNKEKKEEKKEKNENINNNTCNVSNISNISNNSNDNNSHNNAYNVMIDNDECVKYF